MKPEDFERKLSRQPFRPLPDAWRTEILATAEPSPFKVQGSMFKVRCLSSAIMWLPRKLSTELIWPCRRIWAGLAAAWLLILVANLGLGSPASVASSRVPASNAWSMAALKAQQQMLSQMLDADAPAVEPAPKPGPRGEKRVKIMMG